MGMQETDFETLNDEAKEELSNGKGEEPSEQ